MSLIDAIKDKNANFRELQQMDITPEDFRKLADDYQNILKLIELYQSTTINRNLIASEIIEQLSTFELFTLFFKDKISKLTEQYTAKQTITPEVFIRLLNDLVNAKEQLYSIKCFNTLDFSVFKVKTDEQATPKGGNLWILAKKEAFENIDNEQYYFKRDFSKISNTLIQKGYSFVMISDDLIDHIIPSFYLNQEKQNTKRKKLDNLYCHLIDDDPLTSAVNQINEFINQNGSDLEAMDYHTLLDQFSECGKQKKLI